MEATLISCYKRAVDIVLSIVGLVFSSPIILIAFVVMKISDRRSPVFFVQKRLGQLDRYSNRTEFNLYKIRTMTVYAEKHVGAVLSTRNDPRITKLGAFLRKTRIDELPQLYNVLRGEMSVVGPRPERAEILQKIEKCIPDFDYRMAVKPGITGFAQVSLDYVGGAIDEKSEFVQNTVSLENNMDVIGSELESFYYKLLYDMAYILTQKRMISSILTDLFIIVKTPWVMISRVGR